MNNGKICVPVCSRTADEMIEKIKLAEKFADIVELRFDCLTKEEFDFEHIAASREVLRRIFEGKSDKPWLSTFRAGNQGGHRDLTVDERKAFWQGGFETEFGDLEEDVIADSANWSSETGICSYHDFAGAPEGLEAIYERLAGTGADIVKIAVQANDITDTIPLWRLLKRAQAENKPIIPIAMGEAGKWTRILGLGHGAFLTFGSLEPGGETAPGQIAAEDLHDLYRVKQLDEATAVYGVVAGDTSYSSSPLIQNTAFKHAGSNAVFVPLQVRDLDEFMRRMVKPETREVELNFHGLAVTNPHKQAVMRHLDVIDETAQNIGAVNTVKIKNGKFYGYNTDADGFIGPLKARFGDLTAATVAVIGGGGAARACVYALQHEGAGVALFARDPNKARDLAAEFGVPLQPLSTNSDFSAFDIIVNATPLGTKGEFENETVAVAVQLGKVKLVYDLVYNPAETRLIREAKTAGVGTIGGIEMLIAQGAKQFEIWTGGEAPIDEIRDAVLKRL